MRRVLQITGTVLWLVLALVVGAHWIAQAQQAPAAADDPRFTGRSDTLDAKGLGVSRRHFDAGARAAWHSHAGGQLLFVENGRARVQRRGEPVKELAKGQSDYTAADVVHWHGATPAEALVQVAVSFGGETKWLQKVTDDEYAGKRRDKWALYPLHQLIFSGLARAVVRRAERTTPASFQASNL